MILDDLDDLNRHFGQCREITDGGERLVNDELCIIGGFNGHVFLSVENQWANLADDSSTGAFIVMTRAPD